jgi:O-antigen/teichoic acid export membrane protein
MNKYIRAVGFNIIFLGISTIAFLVLTPLAIKVMGEEFYGLWTILTSIMLFSNVGTLGIGTIVNKFSAEETEEAKEKFYGSIFSAAMIMILPMAILTMAVLWLASGLIARLNQLTPALEENFKLAINVCALGILPQYLTKIPQGFLLSQLRNEQARLMDLVASIMPWIGGLLISIAEKNLVWIAIWYVVLQNLLLMGYILFVHKDVAWFARPNRALFKRMRNYSGFLFVESTAISLFQQFDRVIVGAVFGPVYAGVYAVGTSVGLRLTLLSGQITEVLVPYSSAKESQQANHELYRTVRLVSRLLSVVITLTAGLGMVWMQEILSIWISSDYANQYSSIFQVIVLGYCFSAMCRVGHQTLQGMGKVKFTSFIYIATTLLVLTLLVILPGKFGFIGAGLARLGTFVLLSYNVAIYWLLNKKDFLQHLILDNGYILLAAMVLVLLQFFYPVPLKASLTALLLGSSFLIVRLDKEIYPLFNSQLSRVKEKLGIPSKKQ